MEMFAQNQGECHNQNNNQLDCLSGIPRGNCGRRPYTAAIPVATAVIHVVYSVLLLVVGLGRAAGATAHPIHPHYDHPWPADIIVRISQLVHLGE